MTRPLAPLDAEVETLLYAQLRYFGQMAAIVSHELRNDLATINEKTGLIADMVALSAGGVRPLDPDRIGRLASDVAGRIRQTTEVCERLSKLAHSPDLDLRVMSLGSVVDLVVALMSRPARSSGVVFVHRAESLVNVEAEPVLLQLVVSSCLRWILERCPNQTVQISTGAHGGSRAFVRLEAAGLHELTTDHSELLDGALHALGAELDSTIEGVALLVVPLKCPPGRWRSVTAIHGEEKGREK